MAETCRHCGEQIKPCDCGANGGQRHWAATPQASYRCIPRRTWPVMDAPNRPTLHEPVAILGGGE